ncbi:circularly permuted type 2 ATP-grasp protein [Klebsiella pneumoniae]|nr:circularly permuted type 2 ATP-grasp protein [Klebsiella pneumoniae]
MLSNLELMVVKEVHGAGGYGMLVGPRSTKEEREAFRQRLLANPANYIAQDTLALSTCPTFVEEGAVAAAYRFTALRAVRAGDAAGARRPDPRGADRRVAGGQLVAGRRNQGYLGDGG